MNGVPLPFFERDPPVEVGAGVVLCDREDVVRIPRQLSGQIRRFDAVPIGAAILERPDQRRPCVKIGRQLGEPELIDAQPRDDVLANLPDRRGVVAQEPRGHFLFARVPPTCRTPNQRDVAADVLAQQLVRLEQVVLAVLLEDLHPRRLSQRSEMHRRRVDGRRDVLEVEIELRAAG